MVAVFDSDACSVGTLGGQLKKKKKEERGIERTRQDALMHSIDGRAFPHRRM